MYQTLDPRSSSVPSTPWSGPVYHIFPLGLLGAPTRHSEAPPPPPDSPCNIRAVARWIPHLQYLGVQAVLLGPVFQSETHGYDVVDPYRIDSRLGREEDLVALTDALHHAGIRVILDAVFNHVGRSFFAFQDLLMHRERSVYLPWFVNVEFGGDGVSYACWDGHTDLVKLNVDHPPVREYLLGATKHWIETWGADGLRLDAADVISPAFWPILRRHVDEAYRRTSGGEPRDRFQLIGEMVHGDYTTLVGPDRLDSVTNYEVYKGLYSSHNDGNYFEIAYSLGRQFERDGIYRSLPLLTFVDNHDVPRIASILNDERHLYPVHILLFTVPGTPALYYGSEFGILGEKGRDDWPLRPALDVDAADRSARHPDLPAAIARLSAVRRSSPALEAGSYRAVSTLDRFLAFVRMIDDEIVLVMVNGSDAHVSVPVDLPAVVARILGEREGERFDDPPGGTPGGMPGWIDLLNDEERIDGLGGITVPPLWGRVLRRCLRPGHAGKTPVET